jgi:hypothetical protein
MMTVMMTVMTTVMMIMMMMMMVVVIIQERWRNVLGLLRALVMVTK